MENYLVINGTKIKLTQEQLEQIQNSVKAPELKNNWEDFGLINGYYVNSDSEIIGADYFDSVSQNKNIFPSKEEAEACLALSQLLQWRDKYNEGWKPDWDKCEVKHIIQYFNNSGPNKSRVLYQRTLLSFKSEEIRDKFLETFRDLIEIAKPLL